MVRPRCAWYSRTVSSSAQGRSNLCKKAESHLGHYRPCAPAQCRWNAVRWLALLLPPRHRGPARAEREVKVGLATKRLALAMDRRLNPLSRTGRHFRNSLLDDHSGRHEL